LYFLQKFYFFPNKNNMQTPIMIMILLVIAIGIYLGVAYSQSIWPFAGFQRRLTGPSFEDCAKQGYNQGICCGQACQGNSDPNCIDKCRMVGPK